MLATPPRLREGCPRRSRGAPPPTSGGSWVDGTTRAVVDRCACCLPRGVHEVREWPLWETGKGFHRETTKGEAPPDAWGSKVGSGQGEGGVAATNPSSIHNPRRSPPRHGEVGSYPSRGYVFFSAWSSYRCSRSSRRRDARKGGFSQVRSILASFTCSSSCLPCSWAAGIAPRAYHPQPWSLSLSPLWTDKPPKTAWFAGATRI